jgi:hypothetical protein
MPHSFRMWVSESWETWLIQNNNAEICFGLGYLDFRYD